jgi:hypothetical protein
LIQVLKYRYERLRGVSGRIQNALGGLATMGERLLSLLSWRDPRYWTKNNILLLFLKAIRGAT